jgi:structural maintenance of chromosome 4
MEAEAATASAADLQQRLGELQAATKVSGEDAARLKALGAEIGKDEKALAELKRKSEGLSQRAEALQAQIEGAGGEKLRRQRALCDKLQEVSGHTNLQGGLARVLCVPTGVAADAA